MTIKDKFEITYCSNIFKESDWERLFLKLDDYSIFFKKKKMKLSLCLSNELISNLLKDKNYFKSWLEKRKIFIYSFNGFVYAKFHKAYIKDDIYYPDWTSEKRLTFTKKLIEALAFFLPNNRTGSISTMPLSYKPWIKRKYIDYIFYKSTKCLIKSISVLESLKSEKKIIHLDIEPEPTCLIDSIDNFIKYYKNWLIPVSILFFKEKYSYKTSFTKSILRRYIRLCYDISHSSVNFDNHLENIKNLKKNKIKIGKVQISSAAEFIAKNNFEREFLIESIKQMLNSSFLHQIVEKFNNKKKVYNDVFFFLRDFINRKSYEDVNVVRIHFHMPIFENVNTTQSDTKKALRFLFNEKYIKHFEIETYTPKLKSKHKQFDFMFEEYNWLKNFIKNKHDDI